MRSKLLTWNDCKTLVIESYNRITSSMQAPVPSDDFEQSLSLDTVMQHLSYAEKDPFYKTMNVFLNQIAIEFDKKTNEERKIHAKLSNSPYMKAKHVFLACRKDKRNSAGNPIVAVLYSIDQPPDDRLIQIYIDKDANWSNLMLIALHELGHFLGPRHRDERYQKFLCELVINAFIYQVFHEACCSYCGWSSTKNYAFGKPFFSHPEINTFAIAAQQVLEEVRRETLWVFCDMCEHCVRDQNTLGNGYREVTSHQERDILATTQGYIQSIRSLLLLNINEIVHDIPKFISGILDPAMITTKIDPHSIEYSIIRKYVEQGLVKTVDDLQESIHSGNSPEWFSACMQMLEEPVADMFMLKVADTSTRQYVNQKLRTYQRLVARKLDCDKSAAEIGFTTALLSAIRKVDKISRINSIALARCEPTTCFDEPWDWLVKRIPFEIPAKQRYEARILLRESYRKAMVKPELMEKLVFEYVKAVWRDTRYDETFRYANKLWKHTRLKIAVIRGFR